MTSNIPSFTSKGLVINYGEGARGGYEMGKSWVQNCLRPPPSRQGKTFRPPPLLKSGNFMRPHISIGVKLHMPRPPPVS